MIGTPDGLRALPCPIEYQILRAVRHMKGAMRPDDFIPGSSYTAFDWLEFALMSEAVEAELSDPKKESGSTVFNIIDPNEGAEELRN